MKVLLTLLLLTSVLVTVIWKMDGELFGIREQDLLWGVYLLMLSGVGCAFTLSFGRSLKGLFGR